MPDEEKFTIVEIRVYLETFEPTDHINEALITLSKNSIIAANIKDEGEE